AGRRARGAGCSRSRGPGPAARCRTGWAGGPARPPEGSAPARTSASARDGEDASEQAIVAVVPPAPGRSEVQAILSLRVEAEIEHQRFRGGDETDRVRHQNAGLPRLSGKPAPGGVGLRADTAHRPRPGTRGDAKVPAPP